MRHLILHTVLSDETLPSDRRFPGGFECNRPIASSTALPGGKDGKASFLSRSFFVSPPRLLASLPYGSLQNATMSLAICCAPSSVSGIPWPAPGIHELAFEVVMAVSQVCA